MKNKIDQFNVCLNKDDRRIIDELMKNNINVSSAFKMFIRRYLQKIKKINSELLS